MANLNFFIIKQLAILPSKGYSKEFFSIVTPKVLELSLTTLGFQPFANDVWRDASPELKASFVHQWDENAVTTSDGHCNAKLTDWVESIPDGFPYSPINWNNERRAVLRVGLDAYYPKLYGLSPDELRYTLDPQDAYDPDYPRKIYRVLKDKEVRQCGEYPSRRLVLEARDRLEGVEVGNQDGYTSQRAAVTPKRETISVAQPRPENRPPTVQTQLPASPAKAVKEIDPPVAGLEELGERQEVIRKETKGLFKSILDKVFQGDL